MTSISTDSARRAPPLAPLATEILLRAEAPSGVVQYLTETLPLLMPALSADFAAVTAAGWGNQSIAQAGMAQAWPPELVAECLDREAPQTSGPWLAAPLSPREASAEVLVVHRIILGSAIPAELERLAATLGAGLRMVRARGRLRQRA